MTKLTKIAPIPRGVVFIYDPTMIVDIPEDTGSAPVLNTPNCVSVWTRQDIDGSVNLILSDDMNDANDKLVFEGVLETHGCKIAINDSECNSLIESATLGKTTKILIYTSGEDDTDNLICIINNN